MEKNVQVACLDAEQIQSLDYAVSPTNTYIEGEPFGSPGNHTRAWLRRLCPDQWVQEAGTLEAVEADAWMALLGSIVRLNDIVWLSHPDRAFSAEDKLLQYKVAAELGFLVPPTLVTSNRALIPGDFGSELVIKPLGAGSFVQNGLAKVVFARAIDLSDPILDSLDTSPFIIQPRLKALSHLRVVTVADNAWSFSLDGSAVSMDWRTTPAAHDSFASTVDLSIEASAIEVANALQVGYSSQDWIRTSDGDYFLDLNPGGQWMFLPSPDRLLIGKAIADWLTAEDVT